MEIRVDCTGPDVQHLGEDCLHERQQHQWKHGDIFIQSLKDMPEEISQEKHPTE